jgi:hypothetical protein
MVAIGPPVICSPEDYFLRMVSIDISDVALELEACRAHCLPGREMVEGAAVWWELSRQLKLELPDVRKLTPLRLVCCSTAPISRR